MSMVRGYAVHDPWAQPGPPAWALSEVRSRRVFALGVDLVVITILFSLFFALFGLMGFVTFGLSWMLIPVLFPAIALVYNGVAISRWRMATPGMRAFGLEMRLANGRPAPFLNAAGHVVFFYLSWTLLTPFIMLISFVTRDKRCLHDMLAGVVVTRRI